MSSRVTLFRFQVLSFVGLERHLEFTQILLVLFLNLCFNTLTKKNTSSIYSLQSATTISLKEPTETIRFPVFFKVACSGCKFL